jgi:hypothetical protein
MMETSTDVPWGVRALARREGSSRHAVEVPPGTGDGLRRDQGTGAVPLCLPPGPLGRRSRSGPQAPTDGSAGLDRAGRCVIPEPLRTYAGLTKDVTVVGVADRIEIWDTDTWHTIAAEADDYYADIEEVLSEDGL